MLSIVRKVIPFTFKRSLHSSSLRFNTCDKKESVQVNNPLSLEPIEHESHTLKKHDNARRQRLYEFGLYTAACMPKYVQKVQMQNCDQLEILIAPDGWFQVLSFLRNHQHACFNQVSTATAIDVPSRQYRFELIYCLVSMRFSERCIAKTYTDELTPLPSAYPLWNNCYSLEREIYDLFGIVFTNHPDLRRLLTDYGFTGHPLRKDFPLVGYTEVRYDDELKKLVYEPVEYAQEMRNYQLNSPWTYMRNFHEGYNAPFLPPKPEN